MSILSSGLWRFYRRYIFVLERDKRQLQVSHSPRPCMALPSKSGSDSAALLTKPPLCSGSDTSDAFLALVFFFLLEEFVWVFVMSGQTHQ